MLWTHIAVLYCKDIAEIFRASYSRTTKLNLVPWKHHTTLDTKLLYDYFSQSRDDEYSYVAGYVAGYGGVVM